MKKQSKLYGTTLYNISVRIPNATEAASVYFRIPPAMHTNRYIDNVIYTAVNMPESLDFTQVNNKLFFCSTIINNTDNDIEELITLNYTYNDIQYQYIIKVIIDISPENVEQTCWYNPICITINDTSNIYDFNIPEVIASGATKSTVTNEINVFQRNYSITNNTQNTAATIYISDYIPYFKLICYPGTRLNDISEYINGDFSFTYNVVFYVSFVASNIYNNEVNNQWAAINNIIIPIYVYIEYTCRIYVGSNQVKLIIYRDINGNEYNISNVYKGITQIYYNNI